jgi:hypothetical protein
MRWTLIGSRRWVTVHESVRLGLLLLVKPSSILRQLGVICVNLRTLCLDLGEERVYLRAKRVESAINGVKSDVVVASLRIYPLIKVLLVLMLSQADALQMLQNVMHVGVRSRMAN